MNTNTNSNKKRFRSPPGWVFIFTLAVIVAWLKTSEEVIITIEHPLKGNRELHLGDSLVLSASLVEINIFGVRFSEDKSKIDDWVWYRRRSAKDKELPAGSKKILKTELDSIGNWQYLAVNDNDERDVLGNIEVLKPVPQILNVRLGDSLIAKDVLNPEMPVNMNKDIIVFFKYTKKLILLTTYGKTSKTDTLNWINYNNESSHVFQKPHLGLGGFQFHLEAYYDTLDNSEPTRFEFFVDFSNSTGTEIINTQDGNKAAEKKKYLNQRLSREILGLYLSDFLNDNSSSSPTVDLMKNLSPYILHDSIFVGNESLDEFMIHAVMQKVEGQNIRIKVTKVEYSGNLISRIEYKYEVN